MARPVRNRRLGYMPENDYFCPEVFCKEGCREIIVSHEELESIRLSDYENLEQTQASAKMDVSRGTYQRILLSAHRKIADALINGRAIKVRGGHYILKDCMAKCKKCGHEWKAPCDMIYDKNMGICPECGSDKIECQDCDGECSLGETRHLQKQSCTRKK